MTKKILAMFLAVLMVVSIMSTSVLAEEAPVEEEQEKFCLVHDGKAKEHTTENCTYELKKEVAPTCQEDGYKLLVCLVCNEEFLAPGEPSTKTEHQWVGPDCQLRECELCGEKEPEVTGEHTYVADAEKSDPCGTEGGKNYLVCSKCGHEKTEDCKAEHNWNWSPVYDEDGKKVIKAEGVCANCGEKTTIDVLNSCHHKHEGSKYDYTSLIYVEAVAPTCTSTGMKAYYYCPVCDTLFEDENGMTEITWDKEKEEDPRIIAKIDHVPFLPEDLSCKDNGQDLYCKNCHEVCQKAQLAHNYGDWIIDSEATCTAAGSKHRVCKVCGNVETEEIAILAHNEGIGVTVKEPTCTEAGDKTYTCIDCGNVRHEEIAELGHKWDADATCKHTATCLRCGDTKEGTHVYGNWTVIREQTCVKDGERERVCSECGNVDLDHPAKYNHDKSITITVPATCTHAAYRYTICLRDCCKNSDKVQDKITIDGTNYDLTAFSFMKVHQNRLNKDLYLTGNTANKPYYFETTEDVSKAVQIHLEAAYALAENGESADLGFRMYFYTGNDYINGEKTYITIAKSGKYVNAGFTTTAPTNLWHISLINGEPVYTMTVDGSEYYLGTYSQSKDGGKTWNDYTTVSASSVDFITPENTKFNENSTHMNLVPEGVNEAGTHVYLVNNVEILNDGAFDLANHPEFKESINSPKCGVEGLYQICCTQCQEVIYKHGITALEHTWGDWTYPEGEQYKKPTCTKDGYGRHYCSLCEKWEDGVIKALGHDMKEETLVEATCTAQGVIRHYCTRGDVDYQDPVGMTEHDWQYVSTNKGNHKNHNVSTHEQCSVCLQERDLPYYMDGEEKIEHWIYCNYQFDSLEEAAKIHGVTVDDLTYVGTYIQGNCEKIGVDKYVCNCGDSLTDEKHAAVYVKVWSDKYGNYGEHIWATAAPGGYYRSDAYYGITDKIEIEAYNTYIQYNNVTNVIFKLYDSEGNELTLGDGLEIYLEDSSRNGSYYTSGVFELEADEYYVLIYKDDEVYEDDDVTLVIYTEIDAKDADDASIFISGEAITDENCSVGATCQNPGYEYVAGCLRENCDCYNVDAGQWSISAEQYDHVKDHDICYVPHEITCPKGWVGSMQKANLYYESCKFCGDKHYYEQKEIANTGDVNLCTDYTYYIFSCYCGEMHALYFYGNFGHQYVLDATGESKAPTCTEDGYHTVKCQFCEETTRVTDAKLEHINSIGQVIDPNCAGGEDKDKYDAFYANRGQEDYPSYYQCISCEEQIIKHGTLTYGQRHDATCEAYGWIDLRCTVCGKDDVKHIPTEEPHGHKWGEPVVSEDGTVTTTCTCCGKVETAYRYLNVSTDAEQYTYGSKITVTVGLNKLADTTIRQWVFNMSYNNANVTFVGAKALDDRFAVDYTDPENAEGVITVTGVGAANSQALAAENPLVELYFIVSDNKVADIKFNVTDITAKDLVDNEEQNVEIGDITSMSVSAKTVLLGDANLDGSVDIYDAMYAFDLYYNGEYNVAIDVNCDGEVTLEDVYEVIDLYLHNITEVNIVLSHLSEYEAHLLGFDVIKCSHADCEFKYTENDAIDYCPMCGTIQHLN